MNAKGCMALLVTLLFLPACYNIVRRGAALEVQNAPAEAVSALSLIQQRNDEVKPFKGIGKISVWNSDGSQTSRAAWLGSPDGRLRVEFLSLPGQPAAKLIIDGSSYSFLSQIDGRLYRESCADPDLEKVTGVSIKASEVITFLGGGIPVYEYDSVFFEQSEPDGRFVLIFKKNWLGVVEKICFNGSEIEKIEIFRWDKVAYQAEFNNIRNVSGHYVPFNLVITGGDHQGFSFTVDRCWADIDVSPSMFEIAPTD